MESNGMRFPLYRGWKFEKSVDEFFSTLWQSCEHRSNVPI